MSPATRAFVAVLSAFVSASALGGTVTGTVRDADRRQPLGSKVVAAYDMSGTLAGSATTDATGLYQLSLPAGSYRVLAYDPEGFYATMFDGNAESFETSPLTSVGVSGSVVRDFSLVVGGTVSGRVVIWPTRMPLADAVIEAYNLSGTRRGFTTTDANGEYTLVLPPGEYKFFAYFPHPNVDFAFYPAVRSFAEAARVAVTASRPATGIDFHLDLAARLSGVVRDAQTGAPLPGVTVYAYTQEGAFVKEAATDQTGRYRLSLPAGSYRFVIADPARVYATGYLGGTMSFESSGFIGVFVGSFDGNIHFELARGARVSGTVRDASGVPVEGVTVGAYNLDGTLYTSATTDSNGTYELLLAPRSYKLVVFDPEFVYVTRFFGNARDFAAAGPAAVASGQQIGGVNFTLERAGRITGTVREGTSPIPFVTVAAYDVTGLLTAKATTAADGTYVLVIPPGDYRIVAFDSGLTFATSYDGGANSFDETVPRSVAADATVVGDIALRRGKLVRADLFDTAGKRVDGVEVFALDGAGHRVAGTTSAGGGFAMALPPGMYKFVAIDPQGRYSITYYDHAETLAAATWVTVNELTEFLFEIEPGKPRRRGVRH